MIVALDALASWTSFSVIPPTPRWTKLELHVVALELAQALGHRLERALHVGLQHQVERRGLAALDLLEEVLELGAGRRCGDRLVTGEAEALRPGLAERARGGLVLGHAQLVAGLGRLGEPEHLDRHRRRRLLHVVAVVVDECLDLVPTPRRRRSGRRPAGCRSRR